MFVWSYFTQAQASSAGAAATSSTEKISEIPDEAPFVDPFAEDPFTTESAQAVSGLVWAASPVGNQGMFTIRLS